MSRLARRTLRTTAAVAGMAALGVGMAGNALAAPDVSEEPPSAEPAAGTAVPTGNPLAAIPTSPGGQAGLPPVFTFEAPTVSTAVPARAEGARLPVAAPAATNSGPAHVGTVEAGPAQAPTIPPRGDQVAALSQLDGGAMFGDLAGSSGDQQDPGGRQGLATSSLTSGLGLG